jgi:hypothetical protein
MTKNSNVGDIAKAKGEEIPADQEGRADPLERDNARDAIERELSCCAGLAELPERQPCHDKAADHEEDVDTEPAGKSEVRKAGVITLSESDQALIKVMAHTNAPAKNRRDWMD